VLSSFAAVAAAAGATSAGVPHVVLITVDTLRADHLSCYGYHRNTSPHIDRLASEGVRFDQAYTTIPLTGPAHISLFTSRYPQEHGARNNGVATAGAAKLVFLPQVLRKHGYRAGAFVSAWPLTARLTHLDRSFDDYEETLTRRYKLFNSSRYAEDVTPLAVRWLERNAGKRFFLWVHYFDPHQPYERRSGFAPAANGAGAPDRSQNAEMRDRIARYDSEIAYTDHHVGILLHTLDRLKLRDSTLIVVAADHGESLGEHDYVGHGRHLYRDIVRVPLIVRLPKAVPPGLVIPERVSLLDVAPTVVDLVLGPARGSLTKAFAGRSLAPALTGKATLKPRSLRYLTFGGEKLFFPQWLAWLWVPKAELPLRIGREADIGS
jgi:arylsulfatase A-like enzyme